MVSIYPFRGLRYNPEKVDLNRVTAPPYDVIDDRFQQELYDRDPANIVRLDLNRKTPEDSETNSVYTRAAGFLKAWEQDGMFMPEPQPAIYAYSQSWAQDGETITRRGAIVLMRLEAFESGHVLPHEHTLKGPKIDRLNLMQATLSSLSQIFMIYSDPAKTLETCLYQDGDEAGWLEAIDENRTTHRFKPVTDTGTIARLQTLFKEKNLLIADGHHRYETALVFQQEVRERLRRETGGEPAPGSLLSDYLMVFVTNMDDPGLKVFPTHRVIYDWPEGFDRTSFENELMKRFDKVDGNETFSYRNSASEPPVKLRLKPEYTPNLPDLLKTYDAAILEEVVFKGIFAQTGEALKASHHLGFYRDEAEIDRKMANGEAKAVFELAAPDVKLVHRICESGERMPQKSTYFYPKILSGLVLYPYRAFLGSAAQGEHALSGVADAHPLPAGLFALQPQA